MRRWGAGLLGLCIMVGCTGGAGSSGGAPPAPTAASAPVPARADAARPASTPTVLVSPPARVRASYSIVSGGLGAYWVAAEAGLWQRHGLDVDLTLISGSPASMAALIANETQFAVGASDAVLRVQAQNPDVVSLVTTTVGASHRLMARPEIQRLEDLRGKRIGVAAIGDGAYQITHKALLKLGYRPLSDFTWLPTGGGGAGGMISGLIAGAFDAAPLTPPNDIVVARSGAHSVLDVADLNLPSGGLATNTMRRTLEGQRPVVDAFVAGVVEGARLFKEDAALGKDVLARYTALNDAEAIDWAYEVYSGRQRPVRLYLDHAEMRALLDDLLPDYPELAQVQLDRVIDNSVLQGLEARGYFTR